MVFKQDIGVPMGMIFGNLFLYFFESKYIKQAISNGSSKAYKYGVSRFTDDLCTINDGNYFLTSFKKIHPKELVLKVQHQGNQASFLDLDIKLEDSVLVYKTKEINFHFV